MARAAQRPNKISDTVSAAAFKKRSSRIVPVAAAAQRREHAESLSRSLSGDMVSSIFLKTLKKKSAIAARNCPEAALAISSEAVSSNLH